MQKTEAKSPYEDILKDRHFIAGEWQKGQSSTAHDVRNKYSHQSMATLNMASSAQMKNAIVSSVQAFEALRHWSAGKRSEHLSKLTRLLEAHAEAFARLICAEAGKPIGYARGEVNRGIFTLKVAAGEALRFGGEVVPLDVMAGEGRTAYTRRFPVGPVACISPFNFPLNLALHKIAPALAVGCSVVLKPSPFAPLTALAFAALVEEAGFPRGSLNVLLCENEVAEMMIRDERMAMLSFTGSPKVGWMLKEKASKKKVTLELGGNAAVLVDETADLEAAARQLATGCYLYAGQICISTQRIYAVERVFKPLRDLLLAEIEKLKVGDPAQDGVSVGPMIDQIHLDRVGDWVREAVEGGAEVLAGGEVMDADHWLYAPTLLTNTQTEMKVVAEEVFGPVAVIEKVPSFEVGLQAINDSRFGLQAGVYTQQINRMRQAHETLVVGGIMINNIPGFRVDNMPYGGVKDSGFGREGLKYAMEDMTEPRLLVF